MITMDDIRRAYNELDATGTIMLYCDTISKAPTLKDYIDTAAVKSSIKTMKLWTKVRGESGRYTCQHKLSGIRISFCKTKKKLLSIDVEQIYKAFLRHLNILTTKIFTNQANDYQALRNYYQWKKESGD